jgi:hypothetical protein
MSRMPITDPGGHRAALGLVEATVSAFEFLREYGFERVVAQPTFVRFESQAGFVNVFHGRSSYELGVEVGRWSNLHGSPVEEKFSLRDVIELTGKADEAGLRPLATTEPATLGRFVRILAEWTQTYARPALAGDKGFFNELGARSAERWRERQDEDRAAELRAEADDAWRRRDYSAVVQAYTALDELPAISLSRSEQGRLDYARKHER